eukprot:131166_1
MSSFSKEHAVMGSSGRVLSTRFMKKGGAGMIPESSHSFIDDIHDIPAAQRLLQDKSKYTKDELLHFITLYEKNKKRKSGPHDDYDDDVENSKSGNILSSLFSLEAGSMKSTVFTLTSSSVGAGTLTLSFCIGEAGTVPSIFYLVIAGSCSLYTTYVLVRCSVIHNADTFRDLAATCYGPKYGTFIQICLLLLLWAVGLLYMSFANDLFSNAVGDEKFGYIALTIAVGIIIIPLSLMKRISALRWSSLFGFFSVMYTVFVITGVYLSDCDKNSDCFSMEGTKTANPNFLNHTFALNVMIGGFVVQPTILPIYYEMKNHSPSLILKALQIAFAIILIIYFCVAYFGYFTFPGSVDQNVLITPGYQDIAKIPVLVSQILLSMYIVMIVPLFAHAFRNSISQFILKPAGGDDYEMEMNEYYDNIIDEAFARRRQSTFKHEYFTNSAVQINIDHVQSKYMEKLKANQNKSIYIQQDLEDEVLELNTKQHITVTLGYVISAFLFGLIPVGIGTISALMGSTFTLTVCFIFPASIAVRTPGISQSMKIIVLIICAFLCIVSVIQLYQQIAAIIEENIEIFTQTHETWEILVFIFVLVLICGFIFGIRSMLKTRKKIQVKRAKTRQKRKNDMKSIKHVTFNDDVDANDDEKNEEQIELSKIEDNLESDVNISTPILKTEYHYQSSTPL